MSQALYDDTDGSLAMIRDSARTFAARRPGPAALRAKREAARDVDGETWSAMAESGWTALLLPDDLGGAGFGMREQAVLSEALGHELVCEPLAAAGVFSSALLSAAPASAERARLGAAIAAGALVAPAWQDGPEPLRATRRGDRMRLDGRKRFVEGARATADFLVVAGRGEEALLLGVPASSGGLRIADRPTVDGARIAELAFADVEVGPERIVASGSAVTELLDGAVECARLALAAELAGIAAGAAARTVAYTRDRVQFGKPIASFQAVQHRLVDMWMDAELACASVVRAVEAFDLPDLHARRLAVLAAKARCGEAAMSVCRRAVHLHGAMGFTDEHDIGLYLKRAIALDATLGQAETMRLAFIDLENAARVPA